MREKTLGLDIGTNSIGWCILSDGNIADRGVVVFPEGTAAGESAETPCAERRKYRMARRMRFHRKLRKQALLRVLIANGMCPLSQSDVDEWCKTKHFPKSSHAVWSEWIRSTDEDNPYADRAAAAEGKVEPMRLGRALYHISNHRGFKSTRKEATEGNADGKVKSDIIRLTSEITSAGCKTLGQYLAKHIAEENRRLKDSSLPDGDRIAARTPVRGRYIGREEHSQTEFAVIMAAQGIAHDSPFYQSAYKALFSQRPLRSQKHLVGKCPFEPKKNRLMLGHPLAEEFCMRSFVNNLTFEKIDSGERVPLSLVEKETACKLFFRSEATMPFSKISKMFAEKMRREGLRFHYFSDDDKVRCCITSHKIAKSFGDIPYNVDEVVKVLTSYDDDAKLSEWFRKNYAALSEDSISALCKIIPDDTHYAKYSHKAMSKILRFLRKGLNLYDATLLAKLPDLIEDFDEKEDLIILHLQEIEIKRKRLLGEQKATKTPNNDPVPLLTEMFREYLVSDIGLDPAQWKKVYIPSQSQYRPDNEHPCRLPPIDLGFQRNPLALRTLTKVRHLVNYLLWQNKIDPDTTVRIELARECNSLAVRDGITLWNKAREKMRDKAKNDFASIGHTATEEDIDRYILWEEQGRICLYTGKEITLQDLVSGTAFDTEHTIPVCRCGDDSLANKTLCHWEYNRNFKKGSIPAECPNHADILKRIAPWEKHVAKLQKEAKGIKGKIQGAADPKVKCSLRAQSEMTRREIAYWSTKLRSFTVTASEMSDTRRFLKRQLVDTGNISKNAVALLKCVFHNVYAVNGQSVAFARKAWGLQGDAEKGRSTHLHHAIDAAVIAAISPARFTAICTAMKNNVSAEVPPPSPGFKESVTASVASILVRHDGVENPLKQSSKKNALPFPHRQKDNPEKMVNRVNSRGDTIRGQLHKETYYGCIKRPDGDNIGETAYVSRKALVGDLKVIKPLAEKIVDAGVREAVQDCIKRCEEQGKKQIEDGDIRLPSGIPIKRARVYSQFKQGGLVAVRTQDCSSSADYKNVFYAEKGKGSNFRLAIFEKDGKRTASVDNLMDWTKSHKANTATQSQCDGNLLGYVYPGTMAIACADMAASNPEALPPSENPRRLYVIASFKEGNMILLNHAEARRQKDLKPTSKVDIDQPGEMLSISPSTYLRKFLFEGIDFSMTIDGKITFLK